MNDGERERGEQCVYSSGAHWGDAMRAGERWGSRQHYRVGPVAATAGSPIARLVLQTGDCCSWPPQQIFVDIATPLYQVVGRWILCVCQCVRAHV